MKTLTITHELQQALSIDEFRNAHGRRIISMPYWRRTPGGALLFEFITKQTDAKVLLEHIKAGDIYVRKSMYDEEGSAHYSGDVQ